MYIRGAERTQVFAKCPNPCHNIHGNRAELYTALHAPLAKVRNSPRNARHVQFLRTAVYGIVRCLTQCEHNTLFTCSIGPDTRTRRTVRFRSRLRYDVRRRNRMHDRALSERAFSRAVAKGMLGVLSIP